MRMLVRTSMTPAPSTPTIDAHHHLWHYTPDEYGWISEAMGVIRRDFQPEHLIPTLDRAGIDATVAVQARQSLEETHALLRAASSCLRISGVVGWVPLVDETVGDELERFAAEPALRGVRHVLHDEVDDFYMLRPDFNRGVDRLQSLGLRYDILIFERHLPQTLEFVDRHPNQIFVIDHIAKPRIREGLIAPWADRIRELAKRENVYCKLSGMVTEADWTQWTPGHLEHYFDVVLDAFTPQRLMFGSDWPVMLVAADYTGWVNLVREWTAALAADERERIMGGTAIEAYGLRLP